MDDVSGVAADFLVKFLGVIWPQQNQFISFITRWQGGFFRIQHQQSKHKITKQRAALFFFVFSHARIKNRHCLYGFPIMVEFNCVPAERRIWIG